MLAVFLSSGNPKVSSFTDVQSWRASDQIKLAKELLDAMRTYLCANAIPFDSRSNGHKRVDAAKEKPEDGWSV